MKTPNITSAQLVAILAAGLALAAAFGLALTQIQQGAILTFVGLVSAVLLHSDAKIRTARAQVAKAAVESEALSVQLGPTVTGPPAHGLEAVPPELSA